MTFRILVCFFAITLVACKGEKKKEISEADLKKFEQLIEEGKTLAQNKKYDEAISIFKEALKIDSTRVEPNYGLGYALGKSCEGNESRCKESLQYFNKAVAIDPNYRNTYFNRSFTHIMLGDFEAAIADVDKAIEQNPDDAEYYEFRATLHIGNQDSAKACGDVHKAIELGAEFKNIDLLKYCAK